MKSVSSLCRLLFACALMIGLATISAVAATDGDQTYDFTVPTHWRVVESTKAHRVTMVDPAVQKQAMIVSYIAKPAVDTSPQGVERFKKTISSAEKDLVWDREEDVDIGGEPGVRLDFTNHGKTSSYVLVGHEGHIWIITAVAQGSRTYDKALRQLMASIKFR